MSHPETRMKTDVLRPPFVSETLDVERIRKDFPILSRRVHGNPLIYLDSAATSQKPQAVIDALSQYYSEYNANVHRGLHTLSEEATAQFEFARKRVAEWVGGVGLDELIYTKGTTESINLVAATWGEQNIQKGDRIVLSRMEHHANLIPWLRLAEKSGAEIGYIEHHSDGTLDMDSAASVIDERTKLVALTHVSNVLGTVNPVKEVVALARRFGAVILVDGAQAIPHFSVDIPALGVDFYAFSAHKMLGPTGVGFLFGRRELLESMPPYQAGGEMIRLVTYEKATWADLPQKFEAGTPNIADVIAFGSALDYLEQLGMDSVRAHDKMLVGKTLDAFRDMEWVTVYGPDNPELHVGAVSFDVEGIHPHDLSQFLDSKGVAIRAGHHCAQPLVKSLGMGSVSRASYYIYNTLEEVDTLIDSLVEARKYFVG